MKINLFSIALTFCNCIQPVSKIHRKGRAMVGAISPSASRLFIPLRFIRFSRPFVCLFPQIPQPRWKTPAAMIFRVGNNVSFRAVDLIFVFKHDRRCQQPRGYAFAEFRLGGSIIISTLRKEVYRGKSRGSGSPRVFLLFPAAFRVPTASTSFGNSYGRRSTFSRGEKSRCLTKDEHTEAPGVHGRGKRMRLGKRGK